MPSPTAPLAGIGPRPSPGGRPIGRGPARAAAAIVAILALAAAACSGSDGSGSTATTTPATSTTDPSQSPAAYTAHSDPAQPVVVAVGRRFGLLVRVEPSAGRRWQVAGMSSDILLPLGSEIGGGGGSPGDPGAQVLTFVAQRAGTTAVQLVQVGADGSPLPDVAPVTFTVVATPDGLPPPPPETTTTTAA